MIISVVDVINGPQRIQFKLPKKTIKARKETAEKARKALEAESGERRLDRETRQRRGETVHRYLIE